MTLADWTDRCARTPLAFDPVRGDPLPECLDAGDVLDDGSVLLPDGTHMTHGRLWMREAQAIAAAFYGWARVGSCTVGTNLMTGEQVYPMARWPA